LNLRELAHCSVTENGSPRVASQPHVEMKDRYRLYQRENGAYYWHENGTNNQGSLRTKDRRKALKLINAKNESHREPTLNLSIARTYPQRFAQEALGHSSRAVHEAYAKGAMVILPALDEYESMAEQKVIAMPLRATLDEAPLQAATGS
jgi:hypothetical protein